MLNIRNLLMILILISSVLSVGTQAFAANQAISEQKKPDVQYTGIYKDRQLIPNVMAIHCKMNAEDVVKDLSKLTACVHQYIMEMNNENALEAQQGQKDFDISVYSMLNDVLAMTITKSASISGFEENLNKYAEATTETDTKKDTEAAISNTIAATTDIKNQIRDFYSEVTGYEAVRMLGRTEPEVIADLLEANKKPSATGTNPGSANPSPTKP